MPVEVIAKFADDLGSDMVRTIQDYIESQPPTWPPLNAKYLKWKEEHPFMDERMLIAAGHMIDSIEHSVTNDVRNKKVNLFIGYNKKLKHETMDKDGNIVVQEITVADLAKIHEYGTEHIPARPVWRVMKTVWLGKLKEEALTRFHDIIGSALSEAIELIKTQRYDAFLQALLRKHYKPVKRKVKKHRKP